MLKRLSIISILTLLSINLNATEKYTNCSFKIKEFSDICKDAVKEGVSYQYVNEFLLSDRMKERDNKTLELFKPKMVSSHKKAEKKANLNFEKEITRVVEHQKKYKEVYDYVENEYKINREIISAILLKETNLGTIVLKYEALKSLNTLYMELKEDTDRNKRLKSFGKKNVVSIISYCYKNNTEIDKCVFPSSYAGATGIPQFMPMNFHLIKGYNKHTGDLNNMEDAIVSVANFLKVNSAFTEKIDFEKLKNLNSITKEWYDFQELNDNASYFMKKNLNSESCFTADKKGLDYLNKNIKKILKYNNSINYALGVLNIAYNTNKQLKAQ